MNSENDNVKAENSPYTGLLKKVFPMSETISHATLKDKQRAACSDFPKTLRLRVHRSISWIGRAEKAGDDHDARFLFLWIAFNAAYADEGALQGIAKGERASFEDFFVKLGKFGASKQIYEEIWQRFSGPIRNFMRNRYVFNPFWRFHKGVNGYENWEDHFNASSSRFHQAFQSMDTVRVLSFVFERLYVLRNQLIHGGATWNGTANRSQVNDAAAILGFLCPAFIDIMMDNPDADWGHPFYPVVT